MEGLLQIHVVEGFCSLFKNSFNGKVVVLSSLASEVILSPRIFFADPFADYVPGRSNFMLHPPHTAQ